MVLAAIFFAGQPVLGTMMLYPMAIGAACIVTSIIGTFFVKLGANQSIMGALYKGFIAAGVLSIAAIAAVNYVMFGGFSASFTTVQNVTFTSGKLFGCAMVGLAVTLLIVVITEYYTGTGKRPVVSIAQASVTGHGTNVIQGLAVSLESTALPTIVIIAGIIVSYALAGLFGIAIATTAMLALAGVVVALDAFGPVTDNAGGIAEMAGCRRRSVTLPTRSTPSATPPRRSPRAMRSARPASAPWCSSPPIPRTSTSSSPRPTRRGPGRSSTSRASRSISPCRTPMSSSACSWAASSPSCSAA